MSKMLASEVNALIDAAVEEGTGSPIDNIDTVIGDVVIFDKNNELIGTELLEAVCFVTDSRPTTIDMAMGKAVNSTVIREFLLRSRALNAWTMVEPGSSKDWTSTSTALYSKVSPAGAWPTLADTKLSFDWACSAVFKISQNGIALAVGRSLVDGEYVNYQLTLVRHPTDFKIELWPSNGPHTTIWNKAISEETSNYCKMEVVRNRSTWTLKTTKLKATVDLAKADTDYITATWKMPSSLPSDIVWSSCGGFWGGKDHLFPIVLPVRYGLVIDIATGQVCKYNKVTGVWDTSLTINDLQRGVFYHDDNSKQLYHLTFDGFMEKIK